jgi:hypothetical protein
VRRSERSNRQLLGNRAFDCDDEILESRKESKPRLVELASRQSTREVERIRVLQKTGIEV